MTSSMHRQSKIIFKIYEWILCSSLYVKEFDVIVHKTIFLVHLYKPIKISAICPLNQ